MASSSNSIIRSSRSSSSSSALRAKNHYYDVFVSFRGEDTRHNFTDHLFAALYRKGIFAFRDDTKLKKGEYIAPELFLAIQGSHIFIVVFSKNYASSTWCLRELEYILECVQVSGKCVLPIFYDVEPSVVGKQSGSYAEAFGKLEERFKEDLEMVDRWRKALTQVAGISGWEIGNKPQYAEIEEIVKEVINILGLKFSSLPKDLVEMDYSTDEFIKAHLLLNSSDDVRVVGICGMGGIGKTTLATVIYAKISHQFDACCFIDDVSKIYRHDGPIGVQKQILHQTLGEEHLLINSHYSTSNMIQRRLCRVRALIILDNVDKVEQMEKLSLNRELLGAGSRIIIISRDEHILRDYEVDSIYKVRLLSGANSQKLFAQKAFKLDHLVSGYEELAYEVLIYANRLPLAIKVLGSFLFGRDVSQWRSVLARLRESPNKDIMDVFRLSFEGLENVEKEIFLDIACFFNGDEEDYVSHILDCCGFHANIGLSVLVDKSLISIFEDSEERLIVMHDMLQELGRQIVQEESSKEPRMWSRLWLPKHFYDVVLENKEKSVEAVVMKDISIKLMADVLSKMSRLRLLILKNVNFLGSLNCLSNELRYIEWHEYPFMYLPSSFQPIHLVKLILKHSNIKQLWKDKKYLPCLIEMDLSHSKDLIQMPNFKEVPNLNVLCLEGCVKLVRIDPSIGVLAKLILLDLKDCKNLISIPNNIFDLNSLVYINLSGCSKAFNDPNIHLKKLESEVHTQSTSSSILKRVVLLPFQYLYPAPSPHKDLLPSLTMFSSLCMLDISFCRLSVVPDAIGRVRWLEELNLGGNNFVSLPSLVELSRLRYLNLEHCNELESLPELPSPPVLDQSHCLGRGGLYIFNCEKLFEIKERCSSTAFSWMIKTIQSSQQSSDASSYDKIEVVIPGNEIQSFFAIRKDGHFMTLPFNLLGGIDDDNFIGIAFCVLFSVDPYHPTGEEIPTISIGVGSLDSAKLVQIPITLDRDFFTESGFITHMCINYFPRNLFMDNLRYFGDGLSFVKAIAESGRVYVEVESCAIRRIYKQDLHSLDSDSEFFASEDEDIPKKKKKKKTAYQKRKKTKKTKKLVIFPLKRALYLQKKYSKYSWENLLRISTTRIHLDLF